MDRRKRRPCEVLAEDLDREIEDVQWAGSSSRLYVAYDDLR